VYPWYVLHQTLIIVLVWWLAPLRLGPWLEPAVLLTGTLLACWALTAVVRRRAWLRPLFGLDRSPDEAMLRPPARLPHPSPDRRVCR
jgi:glucan biosynthesis protein C